MCKIKRKKKFSKYYCIILLISFHLKTEQRGKRYQDGASTLEHANRTRSSSNYSKQTSTWGDILKNLTLAHTTDLARLVFTNGAGRSGGCWAGRSDNGAVRSEEDKDAWRWTAVAAWGRKRQWCGQTQWTVETGGDGGDLS